MDFALSQHEVAIRLGAERLEAVARLVESHSGLLAELDSETCLVHGDFNPTNVLVQDDSVSALIDWEFSMSGTPSIDVGNLLRHTPARLHEELGHGLREGGLRLSPDWKLRARVADLASFLEFLSSGRSEEFKRECIAKIDELLPSR